MYHRRRRSHSTPTEPSASALIAASTVYNPSPPPPPPPLAAAAAAGAALRHAALSPTPTPIGSIPTKRMLKRRDSYSSASDSRPGVQRTSSTGSLTERSFRKERGGPGSSSVSSRRGSIDTGSSSRKASGVDIIGRRASTGGSSSSSRRFTSTHGGSTPRPLARKVTAYHEEDSSEDYPADDDSSDLPLPIMPPRSPSSFLSFPSTLRNTPSNGSASGSKRVKKQFTRPRDTSSISSSDRDRDRDHERRRHSLDYADSSASLESIAEDPALLPQPAPRHAPLPPKILEEHESSSDDDDDDDDTLSKRTILSLPRHNPPARSVSPGKSALKHVSSLSKPRVSFSDEDSIASFSPYTRAPLLHDDLHGGGPRHHHHLLPMFGIGSRITAPSPPPSDSSQESIIGLESALRYPKGQPPLGAGSAVKKLLSEGSRPPPPLGGRKGEALGEDVRRLRVGPLTPPGTRSGVPEVRVLAATPAEEREMEMALPVMERVVYDSDSDSGESIYSDAYEDFTPSPSPSFGGGAMPGILEIAPPPPPPPPPAPVPRSPPPTTAPAHDPPQPESKPDHPPLPPDFLSPRNPPPPPTNTLTRTPSATSSISSTSTSSFRRLTPRNQNRPGSHLLTTMRTHPGGNSSCEMKTSLRTGGGGGHVRTHSRFSTDSDLPVVVGDGGVGGGGEVYAVGEGMGVGRERAGSEGTVKRRRGGFWGFLKGKSGGGGGAGGVRRLRRRSVAVGVGEKEFGVDGVGMGVGPGVLDVRGVGTGMGMGMEGKGVGVAEGKGKGKKRRLWKVRRLLGLK